MRMPESVQLRHLFDMHVDLEPAQVIASPEVTRMVFVSDGRDGPRRPDRGRGAARRRRLAAVGTDGVGRIDVRATIRTHDGELVLLTNTGVIAIPEAARERFGGGREPGVGRAARALLAPVRDRRRALRVAELGGHRGRPRPRPRHVDYRVFEAL